MPLTNNLFRVGISSAALVSIALNIFFFLDDSKEIAHGTNLSNSLGDPEIGDRKSSGKESFTELTAEVADTDESVSTTEFRSTMRDLKKEVGNTQAQLAKLIALIPAPTAAEIRAREKWEADVNEAQKVALARFQEEMMIGWPEEDRAFQMHQKWQQANQERIAQAGEEMEQLRTLAAAALAEYAK